MSRPKKSTRLLQKLNQSLAEKETAAAPEPIAAPAVPEVSAEPAAVEKLEVVTASEPAPAEAKSVSSALVLAPSAPIDTTTGVAAGDRRAKAEEIIRDHLPLAAGAGLIPLPGIDLVAIGALQLKLLAALARHYNVAFTRTQGEAIVTSLLGSVGGTIVAGAAIGSVAKFIPGLGTFLSITTLSIAGSAVTLAIGRLAADHFEAGGTMADFDLDLAQQAFERKLAEAKRNLA